MKRSMRVAVHGIREMSEDQARYIKQLGVTDVNLNQYWPTLSGDYFAYDDLCRYKENVEEYGFRVAALENIPIRFYDKIMLGLPGREEQMSNLQKTVRNIGRAGIPIFGFHFMPTGVWRTNQPLTNTGEGPDRPTINQQETSPAMGDNLPALPRVARGGAAVSTFDYSLVKNAPPSHGRVFSEDEMWENFTFFIRRVMPIAEEVGLKVAIHPDDPLVPSLGGIARPFRNFSAFERAVEIADSSLFGLTFCLGNWALMGLDQMNRGLRFFGKSGRLHYLHFQAVRGSPERFEETFFDQSQADFLEVLRILRDVNFDGVLVPAHAPVMAASKGPWEDPWQQDLMGLTHAIGYLQGLLRVTQG